MWCLSPSLAPGLYSRRVLGHAALEGGQLGDVLVVQPLHLEVQVHVVCALAQAVLLVLCTGKGHSESQICRVAPQGQLQDNRVMVEVLLGGVKLGMDDEEMKWVCPGNR